jgi:hypothetical protein
MPTVEQKQDVEYVVLDIAGAIAGLGAPITITSSLRQVGIRAVHQIAVE